MDERRVALLNETCVGFPVTKWVFIKGDRGKDQADLLKIYMNDNGVEKIASIVLYPWPE